MKKFIFFSMFFALMIFGGASISAQSTPGEIIKVKLSELEAHGQPSGPAEKVNGIYKLVTVKTSVDYKFYNHLLNSLVRDDSNVNQSINEAYQLFSKNGRNTRILRLKYEAEQLLN